MENACQLFLITVGPVAPDHETTDLELFAFVYVHSQGDVPAGSFG